MLKRSFGQTKEGKEVYLYTLENKKGLKAEITNYGANLVNLIFTDGEGKERDVVLGFDDVSGYEKNPSFFGAVIAPSANRIAKASFTLDGNTYQLKKNNGENNLHSDEELGSHKRIWEVEEGKDEVTFILNYEDGELGFPGKKEFRVTYSLNEENELKISYHGTSDKNTVINPTNHSYFNLKGHDQGKIEDHSILLFASNYTPADRESIPYGEIASVEGTPMDLREETVIGEKIDSDFEQLNFAAGYDHNWVTDQYDGKVRRIAQVKSPKQDCIMEVYTDLPGVQFYAGNFIDEQKGKNGAEYGKRSGLCLETQCYPDSIHKENFPSVVYGPNRVYQSVTIYKFL